MLSTAARRDWLRPTNPAERIRFRISSLSTGEWQSFPENALLLPPSIRDDGNSVPDFYAGLKTINRRLRCDFFEGVVMKRGNAPYPVQLRSDTEDCRAWAKHRFVN